ncbi:MAG: glycosyltransferase [Rikenellaceae bacterium]|nr:glycosyltransferase [Rikenellaceae bacterium]
MSQKKDIVLSAVSINSGGPLSIYRGALEYLSGSEYAQKYNVKAIVHKKELFEDIKNIEFISIPQADNWIKRLYYEYRGYKVLSKNWNIRLWLSLQVTSPSVNADTRAVYMHNPSPFYKWKMKDIITGYRFVLFAVFYKYIYRINLHKNKYLIVQQNWLKDAFGKMYSVSPEKIIISIPGDENKKTFVLNSTENTDSTTTFFYPAYPRIFKNYEVICEAVKLLNEKGIEGFKVILSIDGTENGYSGSVVKKYNDLFNLFFEGIIPYEKMGEYYSNTDCLIFPSKLETWGLPVSEFSLYKKPMLVVDLPYGREAAAGSSCTAFFNPDDSERLAELMEKVILKDLDEFKKIETFKNPAPFTSNWNELFDILTK